MVHLKQLPTKPVLGANSAENLGKLKDFTACSVKVLNIPRNEFDERSCCGLLEPSGTRKEYPMHHLNKVWTANPANRYVPRVALFSLGTCAELIWRSMFFWSYQINSSVPSLPCSQCSPLSEGETCSSLLQVSAQNSTAYTDAGITFQGYTDPATDVTIGLAFPPGSNNEFIGEIISPISNQWVGICLGGTMLNNLLLVAWPYENTVVYSPRYATSYTLPSPYEGPLITNLPSTFVNSTHWKWVFTCQNCTTWTGGAIDLTGSAPLAWALSNTTVENPADPNSTFKKHTKTGSFYENFGAAHE